MIVTVEEKSAREFDQAVNDAEAKLMSQGFQVFASQSHCQPGFYCMVLMVKKAGFVR